MVNGKANRLRAFVFVSASLLCGIGSVSAAPRIKVLKLSITNPTNELRLAEDVAVSVTELKKIAPDFKAGDAIVTTSDATTAALQATSAGPKRGEGVEEPVGGWQRDIVDEILRRGTPQSD